MFSDFNAGNSNMPAESFTKSYPRGAGFMDEDLKQGIVEIDKQESADVNKMKEQNKTNPKN